MLHSIDVNKSFDEIVKHYDDPPPPPQEFFYGDSGGNSEPVGSRGWMALVAIVIEMEIIAITLAIARHLPLASGRDVIMLIGLLVIMSTWLKLWRLPNYNF